MIHRFIIVLTILFTSQALVAQEAQPRIVGGETANSNWHTMAALILKPFKEQADAEGATYPVFQAQFCGGTLLSEDWVLTAAHCVESGSDSGNPANVEVLVGTHSLAGSPDSELLLQVKSIYRHPGYNASNSRNDIALLQLDEPANPSLSSQATAVLALPKTDAELENEVSYDELLTALGWGVVTYNDPGREDPVYTLTLEEVELDFAPNEACQDLYTANAPFITTIFDSMICANEPDPDEEDTFGEDSCQADSGGPLYLSASSQRDDSPQFGITSFGYDCGDFTLPGVYTRVSSFLDWIELATSINGFEMRNLTIGEDDGQNQGINTFPITLPVENAGAESATNFNLSIQHSKEISLSSAEPDLNCSPSSTTLTECTFSGSAIAGGSTKALALTAFDSGGRTSGSEALNVTVTLDKHRDYHRLDNSGTVTLYFGEPILDIAAEPICLTPGDNNSQMRVEVSLANSSTQIDSQGTTVSTTLPEALSLIGKVSPVCELNNDDVLCTLGEIEMESEASAVIGVKAPADTEVLTVSLTVDNDNGLAPGSSPTTEVELDFSREDLETCPAIPSSSSSAALVSSGGGGGAFHLLALLTLALAGLRRRA